jgi:peptidoglycan biosynthesis protein MviN/MurJ (putative lipid II flippase)
MLGLSLLLVPVLDYVGTAISLTCAELTGFVILMAFTRRQVTHRYSRRISVALISSATLIILMLVLDAWPFLARSLIAWGCAGLVFIFTGGLGKQETQALRSWLDRWLPQQYRLHGGG